MKEKTMKLNKFIEKMKREYPYYKYNILMSCIDNNGELPSIITIQRKEKYEPQNFNEATAHHIR